MIWVRGVDQQRGLGVSILGGFGLLCAWRLYSWSYLSGVDESRIES